MRGQDGRGGTGGEAGGGGRRGRGGRAVCASETQRTGYSAVACICWHGGRVGVARKPGPRGRGGSAAGTQRWRMGGWGSGGAVVVHHSQSFSKSQAEHGRLALPISAVTVRSPSPKPSPKPWDRMAGPESALVLQRCTQLRCGGLALPIATVPLPLAHSTQRRAGGVKGVLAQVGKALACLGLGCRLPGLKRAHRAPDRHTPLSVRRSVGRSGGRSVGQVVGQARIRACVLCHCFSTPRDLPVRACKPRS